MEATAIISLFSDFLLIITVFADLCIEVLFCIFSISSQGVCRSLHRRMRESSIFPIPPDVMLIPMVLADRTRAFRLAFICTVASVLGGLLGYGIGVFLFEEIGLPLLEFYGFAPKFAEFQIKYNDWGAWAVFFAGVTPFPYKVITILSGVTALNLAIFLPLQWQLVDCGFSL